MEKSPWMKRWAVALATAAAIFGATLATAQSNANRCFSPIAAAASTATTVNSATLGNPSYKGVTVIPRVSAYTSGNYTVHIQAAYPATPTVFYDILASAAIGSTTSTPMIVYPGVIAASNVSANAPLPAVWRIQLTGASTPSMTIGVDACLAN